MKDEPFLGGTDVPGVSTPGHGRAMGVGSLPRVDGGDHIAWRRFEREQVWRTAYIAGHYGELVIPAHPQITVPGGTAKAYPTEKAVIHRERARWVLEAIHTAAALELKKAIPTVIGE